MGKKQRVVIGVPGLPLALNARSPQIENGVEPVTAAAYIAAPGGEVGLASFILTNLGWRGLGRLLIQLITFFLEHQEDTGGGEGDGIDSTG